MARLARVVLPGIPLAEGWRSYLQEEDEAALTSLRREGWVGRSVGSEASVKRVEKRLGCILVRGKPGRLPNQGSYRARNQ